MLTQQVLLEMAFNLLVMMQVRSKRMHRIWLSCPKCSEMERLCSLIVLGIDRGGVLLSKPFDFKPALLIAMPFVSNSFLLLLVRHLLLEAMHLLLVASCYY